MEVRGVYPGVFDPVTLGHLDIACRAGRVVSKLIVAVAENPLKPTLFPAGQRLEMLREELSLLDLEADVEVCLFSGLLTEFCRESGTRVVIRGLRTSADFPYEFQHATARARLAERIESVFLMASEPHLCISSSLIKEIARLGGATESFVGPRVHRALRKRLLAP